MAEALKCDRCGSFYTLSTKDRPSLVKNLYVGGVAIISTGGNYHKETDLCCDCANKLVRFLKNEIDILEDM